MISPQEIGVYRTLAAARQQQWLSAREITDRTEAAPRTVRKVLKAYAEQGVVEWFEVFPGRRYRLAETPANGEYVALLRRAAEVSGSPL